MTKLCKGCTYHDHGRCDAGICAAVRCLMIAKRWPIPSQPAYESGPKYPAPRRD